MEKPSSNSLGEWTEYVHSGATYETRVARLAEAPAGIRLLLGPGDDERDMSRKEEATPVKMRIVLPWPPRVLSPNSRSHWAQRSREAKRYRGLCKLQTKKLINQEGWSLGDMRDQVAAGGHVHLFLDFHPPNRARRDDDNVIAAFKSGRDGLADALGIDDEHFRIHPVLRREHPVKRGGVSVVITTSGPEA